MVSLVTLPSVKKTPQSPPIHEYGVVIAHDQVLSNKDNIVIQGVFVLPQPQQAVKVHGEPHKSLVLTVNSAGRNTVKMPFSEVICFPDDIQIIANSIKGYFQLNISSYFKTKSSGVYYSVCSLGIYLSNIVQITVE